MAGYIRLTKAMATAGGSSAAIFVAGGGIR
jgi:hypothetical protein